MKKWVINEEFPPVEWYSLKCARVCQIGKSIVVGEDEAEGGVVFIKDIGL